MDKGSDRSRGETQTSNTLPYLVDPHEDAELAEALGITSDEIARWRRGEPGSTETERRLLDLACVVARLRDYYAHEAIADWLHGHSPDLGGRSPVDVLRTGGLAEVLAVIDAQTSGVFL